MVKGNPTSFKLYGHKINVTRVPNLAQMSGCYGQSQYNINTIQLQDDADGFPLAKETVDQTLYHEILHFCLFYMHENDLNNNESFVDTLAHLLHQAFTTMEYEADKPKDKKH